jgi:hypothetical protein
MIKPEISVNIGLIKKGMLVFLVSFCCVSCETTTSQKIVDFHLVRISQDEQGRLVGLYEFHNKSLLPILIPMVQFRTNGVAFASDVGFEIMKNGKWTNPGYYHDGISPGTYLGGDQTLFFEIWIPANLWGQATPFRTFFSGYDSSPSKLEDFQYK